MATRISCVLAICVMHLLSDILTFMRKVDLQGIRESDSEVIQLLESHMLLILNGVL